MPSNIWQAVTFQLKETLTFQHVQAAARVDVRQDGGDVFNLSMHTVTKTVCSYSLFLLHCESF